MQREHATEAGKAEDGREIRRRPRPIVPARAVRPGRRVDCRGRAQRTGSADEDRDDGQHEKRLTPAEIGRGNRQRRSSRHDAEHADGPYPRQNGRPALARVPARDEEDRGHEAAAVTEPEQEPSGGQAAAGLRRRRATASRNRERRQGFRRSARAPIRSNRMPTGTWTASSARKKQALAKPSIPGVSDRSRISSGAMTLVEARKNCDRLVVATSMTRRPSAARAGVDGRARWAAGSCMGARHGRWLGPRQAKAVALPSEVQEHSIHPTAESPAGARISGCGAGALPRRGHSHGRRVPDNRAGRRRALPLLPVSVVSGSSASGGASNIRTPRPQGA